MFGFARLQAFCFNSCGLHDTCGVLNLHGMPGLIGGAVSGMFRMGASSAAEIISNNFDIDIPIFLKKTHRDECVVDCFTLLPEKVCM